MGIYCTSSCTIMTLCYADLYYTSYTSAPSALSVISSHPNAPQQFLSLGVFRCTIWDVILTTIQRGRITENRNHHWIVEMPPEAFCSAKSWFTLLNILYYLFKILYNCNLHTLFVDHIVGMDWCPSSQIPLVRRDWSYIVCQNIISSLVIMEENLSCPNLKSVLGIIVL